MRWFYEILSIEANKKKGGVKKEFQRNFHFDMPGTEVEVWKKYYWKLHQIFERPKIDADKNSTTGSIITVNHNNNIEWSDYDEALKLRNDQLWRRIDEIPIELWIVPI